jgi:murE/murF fusion protein
MKVVGVTGTNGKTTTTFLLDAIFREAGHVTGLIGTVEYRIGDVVVPADYTTPPSQRYQALLGLMARVGVTHVASEVSSHALAQRRVDGTSFDVAVFTNLTRDHLDFHGTMAAYAAAKRRLFNDLLATSTKRNPRAILNVDDARGRTLAKSLPRRVEVRTFSVRRSATADVYPRRVVEGVDGLRGIIATPRGHIDLSSPLVGTHNLSNILAAIAAAQAVGVPRSAIARALAKAHGAPGRLERVVNGVGIHAFVDYAHTPDALRCVLRTGRKLARTEGGKVIVVFGCGGARDAGKRPKMGRVADALADRVFVTSDNPRGENPATIARAIVGGMKVRRKLTVELDRGAAIRRAVAEASRGDVVLIAGKGHEAYQEIGRQLRFFDDRQELALALKQRIDGTIANELRPRVLDPIATFEATVEEVAEAVSARALRGVTRRSIRGVAFTLETTTPGCLFVLYPEARLEQTPDLLAAVARAGAAAALVSRAFSSFMARAHGPVQGVDVLVVDDVVRALHQLAGWNRRRFRGPVVAITGSAGKSSTTQLTAALLRRRWSVHRSESYQNGQLGVFVTLLRLRPEDEVAVVEVGISAPGEMRCLVEMLAPTIAVVLNASIAHTQFLGTSVAHEQSLIWDGAKRSTVLVYDGSDPVLDELARRHAGRRLPFGTNATSVVRAEDVRASSVETRFELVIGHARASVRLPRPGLHHVANALAAASVGVGLELPIHEIAEGLSVELPPLPGRAVTIRLAEGVTLIDDTYNSNLKSALASLERLMLEDVTSSQRRRRVAILADMRDLGELSRKAHEEVGTAAAHAGIDLLIFIGPESKAAASAALAAGMGSRRVRHFERREDGIRKAAAAIRARDIVLVKGSAGMMMHELVNVIRERFVEPSKRARGGARSSSRV